MILTYTEAKDIFSKLKSENKKIIFKTGCFDILHIGHINMFKKAKEYADILIVGVGLDFFIQKYKGKTKFDQYNRSKMLDSISYVDYVIILDETPLSINIDHSYLLELIKPDYYYLPSDDKAMSEKKILANKLKIKILVEDNVAITNHGEIFEPHSSKLK